MRGLELLGGFVAVAVAHGGEVFDGSGGEMGLLLALEELEHDIKL